MDFNGWKSNEGGVTWEGTAGNNECGPSLDPLSLIGALFLFLFLMVYLPLVSRVSYRLPDLYSIYRLLTLDSRRCNQSLFMDYRELLY